jgi:hypothetical protein
LAAHKFTRAGRTTGPADENHQFIGIFFVGDAFASLEAAWRESGREDRDMAFSFCHLSPTTKNNNTGDMSGSRDFTSTDRTMHELEHAAQGGHGDSHSGMIAQIISSPPSLPRWGCLLGRGHADNAEAVQNNT